MVGERTAEPFRTSSGLQKGFVQEKGKILQAGKYNMNTCERFPLTHNEGTRQMFLTTPEENSRKHKFIQSKGMLSWITNANKVSYHSGRWNSSIDQLPTSYKGPPNSSKTRNGTRNLRTLEETRPRDGAVFHPNTKHIFFFCCLKAMLCLV